MSRRHVSSIDRSLKWASDRSAAQGACAQHVWLIEEDVFFSDDDTLASGGAMRAIAGAFTRRTEGLVAAKLISPHPDPWWVWWNATFEQNGTKVNERIMPGRPEQALATLVMICRLSPRLLAAVADTATRFGRLMFFESFLPTLSRVRGWNVTWLDSDESAIRVAPPYTLEEARDGALRRGWRVVHPVKRPRTME
jgi:hypothetical protein